MKPITHRKKGEDASGKLCKCSRCGTERICTFWFDFYTTEATGNLLICESCFRKKNHIAPDVLITKDKLEGK